MKLTQQILSVTQDIDELIVRDEHINHCRVNVVNGTGEIYKKYKSNLSTIENKDTISVRFYKSHQELYLDLFEDKTFMATDWFNLFVFNLNFCEHKCINPDCSKYGQITRYCEKDTYCKNVKCLDGNSTVEQGIKNEIDGINLIMLELNKHFDAKYYTAMIVSMLSQKLIQDIFEEFTGQKCPVQSLRYLDYDFDGEEILNYLYKILHTHSTEFLTKWAKAIEKLETFQKQSLLF